MGPPGRRPVRPIVRSSGGGRNVGAGIAISAVLLAAAAGAVLYTRSQDPIGPEARPEEEAPPRRKKPAEAPRDGPPPKVVTDIFTKEANVVPSGTFDLVLSSDKKGQIEFEIKIQGAAVDIAMIRVKAADQVTREEQEELRSKFKRYEPGGPYILRENVLPGQVEYCQIANPNPRAVSVTATGRTIAE